MNEPAGELQLPGNADTGSHGRGAESEPAARQGVEQQGAVALIEPAAGSLPPPLVVDLDGTLIRTDLLIESLARLLRQEPLALFALPRWLLKGKANLKREVARRVVLDPTLLPYRTSLLDYLRSEHDKGRPIVLATASDERLAALVADHLKLFDRVLASDGSTNLSGERKRSRLVEQFGAGGFDYVGNESRDLPVWSAARKAVVVSPKPRLLQEVARVADWESAFTDRAASPREYLSALRPEHWLKNILVFVPIFAAHLFTVPGLWAREAVAFVAFCCCASSGYLINDLLDLQADRRHPQKRLRPFASGRLPLTFALTMAPALLVLGGVLAGLLSRLSLGILLLYFALTLAYSLSLKRVALLDILVLASLYTLRIIAGSAAITLWPSVWLLGFSMFLFTSLAFVKRYAELVVMRSIEGDQATARGYELRDAELLASKGTASGYAAVLVLALYIASGAVKASYSRHELIWFVCPLLLYWLGYLWLIAHRGKMYHDPLVFALRDHTSRTLILLMVATVVLAI
jgi:4-hydroxybenzoate polyprenyltransferase/phosphoserine phosphatase